MSVTAAGQELLLRTISGEVCLLSDGVEITEAGRVPAQLTAGERTEVRFGPARTAWHVTEVAVIRQGVRMVEQPVEAYVHAGRELLLSLSAEIL